ncbi:MAG TPA: HAD family phosphatase [Mesotoga infera]|uniref:HAD family phosphatase n=1 Tax=Mesotoga infera TaxID=1236046 RepID=A0A7C1GTN5_9BACT|nr:HAD family phosphatase [Mesotoga infera]
MRLFIFDVGGVIAENTNVVPSICGFLDISKDEFLDYAEMENLIALQTGRLTPEEFVYMFSRKLGRPVPENIWEMFFKPEPIKETIEIIKELRRKHRVVAGTNTIEPHFKVHKSRGDYDLFDKVYASHIIGFAKPDLKFYSHILEKESCRPEEAFFTDDTARNVEAALRSGMNAFQFTDSSVLREKLREYL